jgi:hypothetical protein
MCAGRNVVIAISADTTVSTETSVTRASAQILDPAPNFAAVVIVGIAERLVHQFFFEWDEDGVNEGEEEDGWYQKVPGSRYEK